MNPLQHFISMDYYSHDRLSSQEILRLANKLINRLSPYATRITIAGSIRRGIPPKDIDIVLIPKDKENILQTIINMGGRIWGKGATQIYFKIQDIDVNIYYATPETYGAQLLTRTGSKGHNIGLRKIAQQKNLLLNQYGLWRGKTQIAGRTEKEIYTVLGRPRFKKPGERE